MVINNSQKRLSITILAGILQKTQHLFSNDSYIFVVEKKKYQQRECQ